MKAFSSLNRLIESYSRLYAHKREAHIRNIYQSALEGFTAPPLILNKMLSLKRQRFLLHPKWINAKERNLYSALSMIQKGELRERREIISLPSWLIGENKFRGGRRKKLRDSSWKFRKRVRKEESLMKVLPRFVCWQRMTLRNLPIKIAAWDRRARCRKRESSAKANPANPVENQGREKLSKLSREVEN